MIELVVAVFLGALIERFIWAPLRQKARARRQIQRMAADLNSPRKPLKDQLEPLREETEAALAFLSKYQQKDKAA